MHLLAMTILGALCLSGWAATIYGCRECKRLGLSFDGYSFPRNRFSR